MNIVNNNRQTYFLSEGLQTRAQPNDPLFPRIQRSLLVAAAASSILSVIPSLRRTASLALRGIALISSSTASVSHWSHDSGQARLAKVAKIAGIALGLVALTVAIPALVTVSLGVDLGVQLYETAQAIRNGQGEHTFFHLGLAIIDALAIAGIAAGSWQLMVAATSINICLMAGAAFLTWSRVDNEPDLFIDALCYTVLTGAGIASAIKTAQISTQRILNTFKGKNDTHATMVFYGKDDRFIAEVKPGESYNLTINDRDLSPLHHPFEGIYDGRHGLIVRVLSSTSDTLRLPPTSRTFQDEVIQPALNPKEFLFLPVGGTSFNLKTAVQDSK